MWLEGWEIVKMISENKIKDGQRFSAYVGNGYTEMEIKINSMGSIDIINAKNNGIHYGFEWLCQPKTVVQFLMDLG